MKHFLNGVEISPRNRESIGLVSDFTDRPDELQVNIDSVVLPREALTIIQNHIASQGPFEGIPYEIEFNSSISLEYYVDLTESATFRDHEIEVKIKKRKGNDHFFDRADGVTFELMASKGVVFPTFDVPYLIVKDNIVETALTLGISLYVMTKESIQAVKDLAVAIADLAEAVTPVATVPPLPPPGAIVALSIKVAAQLVYTAAVLLATIKLAQQLFELLFPKIRYYKACKVKDLLIAGCNYLGYTFESTILDSMSGLTLLPVPLVKEKKSIFDYIQNDLNFSFTKGYPSASDSTPTIGSLIRAMEDFFNGRTRVNNGVVRLERRDYWQNITSQVIDPALKLQNERSDEYILNTDEAWKRYYIHYQVDYADIHTVDLFDPTDAEYSTEALSPINADLVTIKGLRDVQIPFALGVRKNNLNFIEKLAKGLFEFIDQLTAVFGGNTNFAGQINNRIGCIQISQQYYSTSKLLYTIAGKQPLNYLDLMSASALWNKYHYIEQIQINDFEVRNEVRLRLSVSEFVSLLNNNFVEIDGEVCEILRIEFIDEKSNALISYKKPSDYALGKVETLTINE